MPDDSKTPEFGTRDAWSPGDSAWFEYHCYEGEDSADAELWHRTHQPVTVQSGPYGDGSDMSFAERAAEGMPHTYRVQFPDGHEGDAWEDELMTHPRFYVRPDYALPDLFGRPKKERGKAVNYETHDGINLTPFNRSQYDSDNAARASATRDRLRNSHTFTAFGSSWRESGDNLAEWLRNRESWANSGKSFYGGSQRSAIRSPRGHSDTFGRLPREYHDSVYHADYVIYSYATPQAWHVTPKDDNPDYWVMPNLKYSVTTTRHQSHIRDALGRIGADVRAS